MTTIPITLRDAAAQNDTASVVQLLQNGTPVDEFDGAPLRAALRNKNSNIVRILLDAGADCQSRSEEFMRIAALRGDAASLQLLINQIKQPPLKPDDLDRYLYLAITSCDAQSVRILIAAGADPKPETHQPVKTAASVGSVEILRILHQNGADLCWHYSQPLSNAVSEGHVDAVKYLVCAGSNVNERSGAFLSCALKNGDSEILEILLEAGGRLVEISQIEGTTTKDSLETILLLERYGHDLQPHADRLVASAIENSSEKILEYLLNNFIVTPKVLDDGLQLAASKQSSSFRIFALLLGKGADAGANSSAALKLVIENWKFRVAELLINANAQVADLDASSVEVVLDEADDWEFFITLLERGVTLSGLELDIYRSDDFFCFISPNILLRDGAGKFLPKKICDERIRFVLDTAEMLKDDPNSTDLFHGNEAELTKWFSELLQERQSNS